MNAVRLIGRAPAATIAVMQVVAYGVRRAKGVVTIVAAPLMLGACINVTAPSEPIVIELNINIRQEVIYRLAQDAGNTIEENADIF